MTDKVRFKPFPTAFKLGRDQAPRSCMGLQIDRKRGPTQAPQVNSAGRTRAKGSQPQHLVTSGCLGGKTKSV